MSFSLTKNIYRSISCLGRYFQQWIDRPYRSEDVRRILVLAICEIGDMLRLIPFLENLRQANAKARITLLTIMPAQHDFWKLIPETLNIDENIYYDLHGSHQSKIARLKLILALRKRGFDLTIDTTRGDGMVPNSIMSLLIGSPHRVGFRVEGIGFLNTVKVDLRDDEYIGQQNLRLLETLGIPPGEADIELDLTSVGGSCKEFVANLNRPLALMHPGANWHGWLRCWPPEKYAAIAVFFIKEFNGTVVLLGDKSENQLTEEIAHMVKRPQVVDMSGRTSLPEVAYMIKHADIFIGNDSSLLHLAVAQKTPTIGIFGPTSPQQVLPDKPNLITIQLDMPCGPCYTHQPIVSEQCPHKKCLTDLPVEQVEAAIQNLLKSRGELKS